MRCVYCSRCSNCGREVEEAWSYCRFCSDEILTTGEKTACKRIKKMSDEEIDKLFNLEKND